MPKLLHKLPKYRRHKATGQAVVTLNGRDFYLGPWQSAASKREYARMTSEWLAAGGVLPTDNAAELTVIELLDAFWQHAKRHYVGGNGKRTSEQLNYRTLIRRLKKAYGSTLVKDFGPLRLKAFRASLVEEELARTNINQQVYRVRRIIKWGVENEMVPSTIYDALRCVSGLQFGRTDARESEPIKPVRDTFVDATLPYVAPQVAAMIELQRLTGMRSGEVTQMRTCDIHTAGSVWTYSPALHKTMYRGHSRTIFLGPKAQEILRPWLRTDLSAFLFQPAEAEAIRLQKRHEARKTPLIYGNKPGSNRRRSPRRAAGAAYTTSSYLRAVTYGIQRCNRERCLRNEPEIPSWHPHQLRHNAATLLRREYGLEVARVVLGHKHAAITEVYAEADRARAQEAMARIG